MPEKCGFVFRTEASKKCIVKVGLTKLSDSVTYVELMIDKCSKRANETEPETVEHRVSKVNVSVTNTLSTTLRHLHQWCFL